MKLVDGKSFTVAPEQTFYLSEQGWVKATDVKAGDALRISPSGTTAVLDVTRKLTHSTRYSLEIPNTHTFFVGKDKQLIDRIALDNSQLYAPVLQAMTPSTVQQLDRMASKAQMPLDSLK
ncbi:hypothetical protein JCM19237_6558 [Photobacterium aphoticum]|uniref:Uncharacterized protein n=1 Tax=Photobacterium aphoticum TaxID=754436 RepID=A0A090QPB3_9GAMM|nr:hypothetical protein JCM19237_6558 [Photobacterium aphoticum]